MLQLIVCDQRQFNIILFVITMMVITMIHAVYQVPYSWLSQALQTLQSCSWERRLWVSAEIFLASSASVGFSSLALWLLAGAVGMAALMARWLFSVPVVETEDLKTIRIRSSWEVSTWIRPTSLCHVFLLSLSIKLGSPNSTVYS